MFTPLLPEASTLENIVRTRDIKKAIDFTKDEINKINFKSVPVPGKPGSVSYQWDDTKAKTIEIDLDTEQIKMLKKQIDKLSKEEQITDSLCDLCIKIKDLN